MATNPITDSSAMYAPAFAFGAAKESPDKIHKSAMDFEALLLTEMLRSAREVGASTEDDQNSEVNSSLVDLGEQQFAQALAASGGLGIGKMVIAGLKHAD